MRNTNEDHGKIAASEELSNGLTPSLLFAIVGLLIAGSAGCLGCLVVIGILPRPRGDEFVN